MFKVPNIYKWIVLARQKNVCYSETNRKAEKSMKTDAKDENRYNI